MPEDVTSGCTAAWNLRQPGSDIPFPFDFGQKNAIKLLLQVQENPE